MIRVVVELLVVGQIEQQSEHAALPKQHADEAAHAGAASKAPMFLQLTFFVFLLFKVLI